MDLVSSLPDEVLCHILSFLPTKEAALTSVLSKRWRNLLAFVPNLDIDDSVFLYPEQGKEERHEIQQSFMDFVDMVLALQGDSPIKKLSLKCNIPDLDRVESWICNVLQRGVLELELFFRIDEIYDLPHKIFFSRTLETLRLKSECSVCLSPTAECTFLPKLKTLVIDEAWVCWDKFEILLPAFPGLEELYMDSMEWDNSDHTVSSASLKTLTILAGGFEDFKNPKSISFDTPSLVYLKYYDFLAADYPKVNLTNIAELVLNLGVNEDQIKLIRAPNDEDDVFLRLRNVRKLFSGIRNVQKVIFSANTFEVLSICCESMPAFNNLKLLHIVSNKERGWQAMPVLLRNCPHLETLVLNGLLHYVTDKCGDACVCVPRAYRGCSLRSCTLKSIEIRGFGGTMREIGMLRHFLYSLPYLEEMRIWGDTNLEVNGMYGVVLEMMKLYNEFCYRGVRFLVRGPRCKKWTEP